MTVMSPVERQYEACLARLRHGWGEFADALVTIHQGKLYTAAGIKTWTEFCETVLRQSIRTTQRQIAAADLMGRIAAVDPTVTLPTSQRAAAALSGLEPAEAAQVLHATQGEPTAAAITEARNTTRASPFPQPAPAQPPVSASTKTAPERVKPEVVPGPSPALAVRNVTQLAAQLLTALAALPAEALTAEQRETLSGLVGTVRQAFEQLRLF